jgi:phenylpropionate dioxygenase-like ring-hydroxylating dioxygenase large terminal subunit
MAESLLHQFWYVVAESGELKKNNVLARQVLDEWLACYRNASGQVVIAQDRCLHRCARLSGGKVQNGLLTCGYHGWVYGEEGRVISIPSEGGEDAAAGRNLCAKTYAALEQDGYIYVCLAAGAHTPVTPFTLPRPALNRWRHIRLQNRFANTLANCVENYIDIPHSAYVHHGIFRKPKRQEIRATVTRQAGHVCATYHGETMNLGSFSWFLNPRGRKIKHEDHFFAPNITSVHYYLPSGFSYFIASQSVPVSHMETLVYTDISYDFGPWTRLAKWIVHRQAQRVIDQDIAILGQQGEVIKKYGEVFCNTTADIIHVLTGDTIAAMERGMNPSDLAERTHEIRFTV